MDERARTKSVLSLRARVRLLVALVVVPLFVYSFAAYLDYRDREMARARQNFQQLIRSAQAEESRLLDLTRNVLRIAAKADDLEGLQTAECNGLMQRLLQTQSHFMNFGAVLADGMLFCSGREFGEALDFGDRPWFRDVVARKALSRGYYLFERLTGRSGLFFAYPVLDAAGEAKAVVFADTGDEWLASLLVAEQLPAATQALIATSEGKVLFRYPDADPARALPLPAGDALSSLLKTPPAPGLHEATAGDGQRYIYGIAPLNSTGGDLHIVVVAPKSALFAAVEGDFRNQLLLLFLLAVASVLLGQRLLDRAFVRWAERLCAQIRQVGDGERRSRLPETASIPELREIDTAFNAMTAKLAAAEVALADSRCSLTLALEGADLATWEWLPASGLMKFNARWAEMLGNPPQETCIPISDWEKSVCPEDWPQLEAAWRRHLEAGAPFCECEFRCRHRDGYWVWFFGRGRVIERNEAGEALRLAGTFLDLTSRRATEEKLRQRTEELAALVDAMPALVWIAHDADCREIVGNRMAYASFPAPPAAAQVVDAAEPDRQCRIPQLRRTGSPWEDDTAGEAPLQRAAAQARLIAGSEIRLRRGDGSDAWIFGNAAPLFDQDGRVRGAVAAFIDITRFKAIESDLRRHHERQEELIAERTRELSAAKESAERASQAKSHFLANVSHELRPPLTGLIVLARLLVDDSDGRLSPQQAEYARMIGLSGKDLLQLIDELLDLGKIEAGRSEMHVRPVPFPDVMQNVLRTHRHVAKQKGLDFRMEIDADVPPAIVTDPLRLQQLLRNLLANAIEFTRKGSITLRIRRAIAGWHYTNPALARAEEVIAFDVVDTGVGIAPDRQPQMLGVAAGRSASEHGGTGLGLAIAREIAVMLGGELAFASIPGEGSTFTLYLPLAYAGPVPQEKIPEKPAGGGAAAAPASLPAPPAVSTGADKNTLPA